MQLSIHSHGIVLSNAFRQFVRRKAEVATEKISDRVRRIQFYLVDSNGPNRSGADKSCRVVIQFHKQKPLVLEDCDANLGVVIARITDRLEVAVGRRVERMHSRR